MLTNSPENLLSSVSAVQGFKLVNGSRIYYEIKGQGQVLVFIHGFGMDGRIWDSQFHFFSKRFCCLRFDLRGFGQSALPGSEPYTFQDDLKSLLFSLGLYEPVILVGHSMGARIALDFAVQFPRFTKAVVLADAAPEAELINGFKPADIFNKAKKKGIEYVKRKWFAQALFEPARRNKWVAEFLEQIIHTYSGWHFVDQKPAMHFSPFSGPIFTDWMIPVLILFGELDLPDYIRTCEEAAAGIPAATIYSLPDTGHLCNLENPSVFNREVQEFLEKFSG